MAADTGTTRRWPKWVPAGARLYLSHTEEGLSLRALARREGCHASTVLRHVRRFENRRDDPLVDEALAALGRRQVGGLSFPKREDELRMTVSARSDDIATDETMVAREARRVLRRLCEAGTILVISADMDQAAVLKQGEGPQPVRIAVLERRVARAFALKDWIACERQGRISTYAITSAGRAALKRLIATESRSSDAETDPPSPNSTGSTTIPPAARASATISPNRPWRRCRGARTGTARPSSSPNSSPRQSGCARISRSRRWGRALRRTGTGSSPRATAAASAPAAARPRGRARRASGCRRRWRISGRGSAT